MPRMKESFDTSQTHHIIRAKCFIFPVSAKDYRVKVLESEMILEKTSMKVNFSQDSTIMVSHWWSYSKQTRTCNFFFHFIEAEEEYRISHISNQEYVQTSKSTLDFSRNFQKARISLSMKTIRLGSAACPHYAPSYHNIFPWVLHKKTEDLEASLQTDFEHIRTLFRWVSYHFIFFQVAQIPRNYSKTT